MKQVAQLFLKVESQILNNRVFVVNMTHFSETTLKLLKVD